MTGPAPVRAPLGTLSGQRPSRVELPRLTALRALAALAVFGYHLGRWDVLPVNPLPIGYAAVGFFFVLSGFVLAWTTPVGVAPAGFYRRRLARIYPLHLLCLLLAAVAPVVPNPRTAGSFVPNVLLLQAWVPVEEVAFGWNGVSWSLSCELAFYAALPLLLRLFARQGWTGRWGWAAGLFAVTGSVRLGLALTEQELVLAYAGPALRASDFVLGVVAAAAVRAGLRLPRIALLWAAAPAVPLVVALPFPGPDVVLAPLWLVVIVLSAQADLDSVPGRVLTHRWLVYAGEVSFAFYLVHELVLLNLPEVVDLPPVPRAVLTLLLASTAAVALHHGVERPARERLLRT